MGSTVQTVRQQTAYWAASSICRDRDMEEGELESGEVCEDQEEEALQSRDLDPEEFLLSLGFGGSDSSRQIIPTRFVQQQSQAKGVSVESFLETQTEMVNRFESGFSGFRGFSGSLHSRPSSVVENILQSMNTRKSEDKKQLQKAKLPGTASVPSRFKLVNPRIKSFQSIVEQVTQESNTNTNNTNVKVFKQVASRVIQTNRDREAFDNLTKAAQQNDK